MRAKGKSIANLAPVVGASWLLATWPGLVSAQRQLDDIDGVWQGSLSIVAAAGDEFGGLAIGDNLLVNLEISGLDASVSILTPEPLDLRGTRLDRLGANATVFSLMGASGGTDNWAVTVTNLDNEAMLVVLSRVMSRRGEQSNIAESGSLGAIGQLRKITR